MVVQRPRQQHRAAAAIELGRSEPQDGRCARGGSGAVSGQACGALIPLCRQSSWRSRSVGDWTAIVNRFPAASSRCAVGPTQYAFTRLKCFLIAIWNRLIRFWADMESDTVVTRPLSTTSSLNTPPGVIA